MSLARRSSRKSIRRTKNGTALIEKEHGSVLLEAKEAPNDIYLSPMCSDGKPLTSDSNYLIGTSAFDLFLTGVKINPNAPCLGTYKDKNYTWITYQEVKEMVEKIGSALIKLGCERSGFVAIYSKNCREWDISQLGAFSQGVVVVPLYDTLGETSVQYIIEQTSPCVVVVDDEEKVNKLLSLNRDIISSTINYLIAVNDISLQKIKELRELNINVLSFQDVLNIGDDNRLPVNPGGLDDLATVMYTSGTTGMPKGVMLTHRSFLTTLCSYQKLFDYIPEIIEPISPKDTMLSYLPSAHILNQMLTGMCLSRGSRIGYSRGVNLKLLEDIKALRPTFMGFVPRVLNKVYNGIWDKVGKKELKKKVLQKAVTSKTNSLLKHGMPSENIMWDRIVFKSIQRKLGGRLRLGVVTAAPISNDVLNLCRAAFGCILVQAYGQTETCGAATCSVPSDGYPGHTGMPLPCCEIKLLSVPEMGYYAKNKQGEILVRGENCFSGYYKNEAKTKETIDSDNWVYTGDIGEVDSRGQIKIIDRKKSLFKLAQGEYVSPEKVEGIYETSPLVENAFVHGDSLETYSIALIYPNYDHLRSFITTKHPELIKDDREFLSGIEVCKVVQESLHELGRKSGLNKIENVKKVHLIDTPFSIENNLMTPTLKYKRPEIRNVYAESIKQLYS